MSDFEILPRGSENGGIWQKKNKFPPGYFASINNPLSMLQNIVFFVNDTATK
jgi:hypothetical protein